MHNSVPSPTAHARQKKKINFPPSCVVEPGFLPKHWIGFMTASFISFQLFHLRYAFLRASIKNRCINALVECVLQAFDYLWEVNYKFQVTVNQNLIKTYFRKHTQDTLVSYIIDDVLHTEFQFQFFCWSGHNCF